MPQQQLSRYSNVPLYNIKAVEQATGVAASTLRVWERRYNVPTPNRNDTGYRLYAERDIATVTWLKSQLDEGLSISQAVARLESLRASGEEPVVTLGPSQAPRPEQGLRSMPILQDALVAALLEFKASRADDVLAEAFALYPVETVALSLMQPTLVEIGEGWHRGDVTVAQEHFASAHLRQKLDNLFNQALHHSNGRARTILCACARGEMHEMGILLVALFLRRRGYTVIYLGQNVPEDELIGAAQQLRPALVLVSASTEETVGHLRQVAQRLAELPEPRPRLGYGGRIFHLNHELQASIPGEYLGDDAQATVDRVAQLLAG